MPLDKEQLRERLSEVRDLWCGWDPIGVTSTSDWPRDEYDAYLGPTLGLLESGASLHQLVSYLASVELENMGLNDTVKAKSKRIAFAADLREWYEKKWAETTT